MDAKTLALTAFVLCGLAALVNVSLYLTWNDSTGIIFAAPLAFLALLNGYLALWG